MPSKPKVSKAAMAAKLPAEVDERSPEERYRAFMRREQKEGAPMNRFVDSMLTDLYQLTMTYAYWKTGRANESAVFDLFFRKAPFRGEFTIFAGLEEVIRYVDKFKFHPEDIDVLRANFPMWEDDFFTFLSELSTKDVKMFACQEGSVVFPRVPLIRIEGPLAVCQLLETTALVLVNYASLLATNAARHRLAVGPNKSLLEFGLRRAQGPDGAMSASRYAFVGGFDGTSNVKAGMAFGIAIKGTHAHSFVVSYTGLGDLQQRTLVAADGKEHDFVAACLKARSGLDRAGTNDGELAAFIAYAQAYPKGFLALVDTYDTLESGVWNYVAVALALAELGHQAIGIRLDSGDLAYLSRECRRIFTECATKYKLPKLATSTIVASNDISESVLWALKEQGHEIDAFGIGTNLVTCKSQPALGGVYKLVQVGNKPRIKISQDAVKVTIPGKKECYRLFDSKDKPVLDLMVVVGTSPPQPHHRVLCRHPFDSNKRVYVTPSRVEPLHRCVWAGKVMQPYENIHQMRDRAQQSLINFREDHLRRLNPTPYKVSVTSDLYTFMHDLWLSETPISEIK